MTPHILGAIGQDSSASFVGGNKYAVVWQDKTAASLIQGTVIDFETNTNTGNPQHPTPTQPQRYDNLTANLSRRPIIKAGSTSCLLTWMEGSDVHGKFVKKNTLVDVPSGSLPTPIASGVSKFDMNYSLSGDSFILAASLAHTIEVYRIERRTAAGGPTVLSSRLASIPDIGIGKPSVAAAGPPGAESLVTWLSGDSALHYKLLDGAGNTISGGGPFGSEVSAFSSTFDDIGRRFLIVFSSRTNLSSVLVFLDGVDSGVASITDRYDLVMPDIVAPPQLREPLVDGTTRVTSYSIRTRDRQRAVIEIAAFTRAGGAANRFVLAYYDSCKIRRLVSISPGPILTDEYSYEFTVFSQLLNESGQRHHNIQMRFPGNGTVPYTAGALSIPTMTMCREATEHHVFLFDDPQFWISVEQF